MDGDLEDEVDLGVEISIGNSRGGIAAAHEEGLGIISVWSGSVIFEVCKGSD